MSPYGDERWSLFVRWWMKPMSRFWRRNWLNISKSVFLSSREILLQRSLDLSKSRSSITSINLQASFIASLLSILWWSRLVNLGVLSFHLLRTASLSGLRRLYLTRWGFLNLFISCRFAPTKQWYIDQMILLMVEVYSWPFWYLYNLRAIVCFIHRCNLLHPPLQSPLLAVEWIF
jgi:hypothetical protein